MLEHPLAGTYEKLKRANESIKNLNSEISGFFKKSEHPIIPYDDDKLFSEAVAYHSNRPIPLRFSVVAGEIVHHLRSSLDHVMWQLTNDYIRRTANTIDFPVFAKRPTKENEITRYAGKIKGITSVTARNLIEQLQPYNRPDPLNDPLLIVHDMDRFDKHRELAIVFPTFNLKLPIGLLRASMANAYGKTFEEAFGPEVVDAIQKQSKISPQVSFREFGQRENEPVIPALSQSIPVGNPGRRLGRHGPGRRAVP